MSNHEIEFLTIKNHHVESCGLPPVLAGGEGYYLSYFENEHTEQWVFVKDFASGVFYVAGGDIGWDNRLVGAEAVGGIVLNWPERFWVLACLHANKLSDEADRVMQAWSAFDDRIRGQMRHGDGRPAEYAG